MVHDLPIHKYMQIPSACLCNLSHPIEIVDSCVASVLFFLCARQVSMILPLWYFSNSSAQAHPSSNIRGIEIGKRSIYSTLRLISQAGMKKRGQHIQTAYNECANK